MTVFFIYKQITDKAGNISKVELVECDQNETNASRFVKLYNLQVPTDLRNRITYQYLHARVTQ